MTLVTDLFTRADGPIGANWTIIGPADVSILTNEVKVTRVGAVANWTVALHNTAPATAEHWCEVSAKTVDVDSQNIGGGGPGVNVNRLNGYGYFLEGGSNYMLYLTKRTHLGRTILATKTEWDRTSNFVTLRLTRTGNNLVATSAGETVTWDSLATTIPATDETLNTNLGMGFGTHQTAGAGIIYYDGWSSNGEAVVPVTQIERRRKRIESAYWTRRRAQS